MTATPFLLKTSKEFKADRDGKNQSACGHKKILYRNIICQRPKKAIPRGSAQEVEICMKLKILPCMPGSTFSWMVTLMGVL